MFNWKTPSALQSLAHLNAKEAYYGVSRGPSIQIVHSSTLASLI